MSTVILGIVDGERGRQTREGWVELERLATVTGLTSYHGYAKLDEALEALDSHGEEIGQEHPDVEGLYLDERTPQAKTPDTVEVRLTYRKLDEPDREEPTGQVGASVKEVQTYLDKNGDLITVSYTYPADYKHNPAMQNVPVVQPVKLSAEVPYCIARFKRREGLSPLSKARAFVGRVNNDVPWFDPEAFAREWKCISILGDTTDDGASYEVTYEFAASYFGWDPEDVRFIDPYTGSAPDDLVEGVGIKHPDLPPEAALNSLKDW